MFSRRSRRRLYQVISIILCATILAQSSPLPAWPYLRSRPVARATTAGVRPAPAAAKRANDVGAAPLAVPTPSAPAFQSARSTPQPGSGEARPIAVQAAFHLPRSDFGFRISDFGLTDDPQSLGRVRSIPTPAILRPNSGQVRNLQSPISNLQSPISNIPLTTGWNLISLPKQPPDTAPAAVLSSIAGQYNLVYAYDGCDAADPWKLYDPAAPPPAIDLTAIDHRIGLWIEMTADATLDVAGTQPTSTDIPLCAGWNLIGYPLDEALPVAEALASIEGKYDLVFAYDPTDVADPWEVFEVGKPAWSNDLQVMEPGRGFWVHATADATLTLGTPEPTPTPTATPTLPPAQGDPPTAVISSPDDGAEVTDFVDIVGTADDPDGDLVEYRLQYRQVSTSATALYAQRRLAAMTLQQAEAEWTTIATGNAPVVNDVLGRLDPTLLRNGMYEIRVLAIDAEGQQRSDIVTLIFSGDNKIGHFSLSFIDLTIPMAGLDIEIIRNYDSRDKRVGDFGFGWTLDVTDITLAESGVAGEGWQQTITGGLLPTYCLKETEPHIVTVTFPDGEVHASRMTVSPQCQSLVPIRFVRASFAPLPGTYSRLTPSSGINLMVGGVPGGPVTLLDIDQGLTVYDPRTYQLDLREGTRFVLSDIAGLQSIIESNGNTLTFSGSGISHSTGKSVNFARDELGRITQITDPRGNAMKYTYDATGDLVSVTDRSGNTTTFTYVAEHYLTEIHDPLGRTPMRSEYDADGRLIRQTDAGGKAIEYSHDVAGRKETITDRLGNVSTIEYDANGFITRITDPDGGSTSYTNDSRGNRTSMTDPLGNTTHFRYDGNDQLISETDPLGNTFTYTYDSMGRPLSSTDPAGDTASFSYDDRGNLVTATDGLGDEATFTYDDVGNATAVRGTQGCTVRYEYDQFGRVVRQIDPLGNMTTFAYDANGNEQTRTFSRTTPTGVEALIFTTLYDEMDRPVEIIYANGARRQLVHDAIGRQVAEIDQLGRRTDSEYDATGRLVKRSYPDGTFEAFTYDDNGSLLTSRDRAGRITSNEYDALGRLIKVSAPDSSFSTFTYDLAGRLVGVADARSNTTTYAYDAAGRTTAITDALGRVNTYTYDGAGRLTAETDANGHTTRYAYDANGQMTEIIYPDSTSRALVYDARGRRTAETDQGGNTTQLKYDCLDRVTKITDPLGSTVLYGYDEVGNLIHQTDAGGKITQFGYDELGRLTRRMLPLGQFETKVYDAAGNAVSRTDFDGDTTVYEHDVNNRLVKKTYPDGSTVTYTYTPTGQRASVTDSQGITQYQYDTQDRLVHVIHPDGRAIRYTYDAAGNRTSVTTPAGTTTYTYDALNRLETVTDPDGGVTTYTYDAVGNRATVLYPNATVTEYTYDSLNRLTQLVNKKADGTVISSYAYTLGPAGNRLKVVEHSGRTVEYTYDALYRLTQEKITEPGDSTTIISYTYDAVGNRLTKTVDGVTSAYTYDANDRLLSEGDTTYTYDANGNVRTQTSPGKTVIYEYDFENRLIRATTTRGVATDVVEYVYDADGNRVQKVENGTVVTNYLVDPSLPLAQVLLETDGAGNVLVSYVHGDDLVSMKRGGSVSYFHYDGQMSTRQLTDAAGLVTDLYKYDAFGVLLQQTGATDNNYLYTGEQFDLSLDSYYLRARYYDPAIGRFLTQDTFPGPADTPATWHQYLYADANPVNRWDPTGHFSLVGLSISTAIAASLATIYNSVVVEVGFTTMSIIEGVSKGYSDEQIFYSWLGGQVVGLGLLGFGGLLRQVSGKLGSWIRGALRGRSTGPRADDLGAMFRHISAEVNNAVGPLTGKTAAAVDKKKLVAALRQGSTTARARQIADKIEAGEIQVMLVPRVNQGKWNGVSTDNLISIATEGRTMTQIAGTAVHEGTHVIDILPRTKQNTLYRELNAFLGQIAFLRQKGAAYNHGFARVFEQSGICALIHEVSRVYRVPTSLCKKR
jgi:RHS repeat-associated protein